MILSDQLYQDLDFHGKEIIEEVSSLPNGFASFDLVFHVLLSRYGLDSAIHLVDVNRIASIALLKDFSIKVRVSNSIICIKPVVKRFSQG